MVAVTQSQRPRSSGRGHFKVLVVDDNHSFRKYVCRYLESLGFAVAQARTGEEGLRRARERSPDLIFMDLCLGYKSRFSGNETMRALKADEVTRNIPIIAMSGVKEGPEDEVRARRDGAEDFFTKHEILERGPFLRRVSALLMLNRTGALDRELPSPCPVPPEACPRALPESRSGLIFTVLVIDDDEETHFFLKTLFAGQPSYRIISAASGAQGLRLAASELPDAVILDLIMPEMDGREVCRRLREQEKTFYVPILILTGDMRVKQEIDCLDLGADDFMVRPVNGSRLTARLRSLIRRHRFRGSSKGILKVGAVSLDITTHVLAAGPHKSVLLTPTESALCALLMSAEGRPVDKKLLFKKLFNSWPRPESAAIKTHVCHIRDKLGTLERLLVSHKENGYAFNVEYAAELSRLRPG